MNLEFKILNFLNDNNNGNFIDITFIDEDYKNIISTLEELKGRNLVVIDAHSSRNFEAFGISNERKYRLKAKINTKGEVYLHSLRKKNKSAISELKEKRSLKLSYFFNL